MLAAHRDQENLVCTTQVSTKQQPKTPGARFPKTPLAFRNNENAPTVLPGKTRKKGGDELTARAGVADRIAAKGTGKGPAVVTPAGESTHRPPDVTTRGPRLTKTRPETRARAPLGNKTTNAKARTERSVRVKDIVKEIERTQRRQTTAQRPNKKPAELVPAKLSILADGENAVDDEEPEYAPPQPDALPYESDVLPKGGLTFEDINKHFLRGFYEHFHGPVGEDGLSHEESKFRDEMQAVLKQAEERNEREAASLDWNMEDVETEPPPTLQRPEPDRQSAAQRGGLPNRAAQRNPSTVVSRRAASALAMAADSKKSGAGASLPRNAPPRRPLSALAAGPRVRKQPAVPQPAPQPAPRGHSAGEAASRTTIGYNRGRTASSMVHPQGSRPNPGSQPTGVAAGTRRAPSGTRSGAEALPRPQFLSVFDHANDEDLPGLPAPCLGPDEDDEFELKLTM